MLEKIKSIDFLSVSPSLRIQNQGSYKTTLGGCISIIIALLGITSFIYFGRELFAKEEPSAIVSDKLIKQVGPYEFGRDGIQIFITIADNYYQEIVDPKIFNMQAYLMIYYFEEGDDQIKFKFEELEIGRCNKYYDSADDIYNTEEYNIPPHEYFCFNPDTKVDLTGYWGSSYVTFLEIYVSKCKPTLLNQFTGEVISENNECLDDKVIEEKLNGASTTINITNTMVDSNNNQNPVTTFLKKLGYYK